MATDRIHGQLSRVRVLRRLGSVGSSVALRADPETGSYKYPGRHGWSIIEVIYDYSILCHITWDTS